MRGFSLYGSALRLSAQTLADVPNHAAFARASDINALIERAQTARIDVEPRAGGFEKARRAWDIRLPRTRFAARLTIGLLEARRNESLTAIGRTERFSFQSRVIFIAQGADATRIRADITLTPRTVTGRLMLPALKLARRRLEARLAGRLSRFARAAEAAYTPVSPRKGAAG